jgi:hypothetical protein
MISRDTGTDGSRTPGDSVIGRLVGTRFKSELSSACDWEEVRMWSTFWRKRMVAFDGILEMAAGIWHSRTKGSVI